MDLIPQPTTIEDITPGRALRIRRHFTSPDVHPFETVEWELRDARIGHDDRLAFEQRDIEFPTSWSQNATNIVAQKYFRGQLDSPTRERSVKQMISRVAGTIATWGRERGYFATSEDGDAFEAELTYILLHQMAAFNSPVWFNVGHEESPQCSACQPYDALISTPEGMVPIGEIVEDDQIGREVYDANGITRVVAVKHNGRKPVWRVTLSDGNFIEATPDHVVRAVAYAQPQWLRVDQLQLGTRMHMHPHGAEVLKPVAVGAGLSDAAFNVHEGIHTSELRELEIVSIEKLGVEDVYDIQTESGEYLTNNVAVHNCFILSVQDTMESILNWNTKEGLIFRGGSGSGINLSNIRGSMEPLAKGGTASGPVSFMRGADSWAGTIKSGGKTRRAAKMVVLDVDHPDIRDFIRCKAQEEEKAAALRDAGFDMSIDGEGFFSIQYQNANNSVRVTDEFMRAVEEDREWRLIARTTGEPVGDPIPARELLREIAEAAWRCADPGVQYDTVINQWHTSPNSGRINASNPCCFVADTLVRTDEGPLTFAELHRRVEEGEQLPSAQALDGEAQACVDRPIVNVWVAGETRELMTVETAGGHRLQCTPEHWFLLETGDWVEAAQLAPGDLLRAIRSVEIDAGQLAERHVVLTYDAVLTIRRRKLDQTVPVYDLEVEDLHNFTVGSCEGGDGIVVHNSEYMHVDDSACNLASLNLMKFRREDGSFDVECFEHAVDVMLLAQEIIVGPSSYPTEQIAVNARAFRQLGLGYANLGAYLMSNGMPYDSDAGRGTAAAITALMTGRAYRRSAETAAALGPYERYAENRQAHNDVMRMHRDASYAIPDSTCADKVLLEAARRSWDETVDLGDRHGYRNAQASVLAPTGTISFLMDCDTTGVEPDFSLVKFKELVGGGQMTIVNGTVPLALRTLGYSDAQIEQIAAHINEHGTIIGAPELAEEHLPVFDVAVGERAISPEGHLKMMGAVQPFISGAISKTINMPQTATVEDIAEAYLEAWRLGIKALAIYRDGSKTAQALRTDAQKGVDKVDVDAIVEEAVAKALAEAGGPARRRMPRERQSITHKFSIAGHEGYITAGMYEDGSVGEIFLTDIGKEGSTLRGMMNSFATAISIALQYGVPLETLVRKFSYMRFEPEGITQNTEIPFAKSMPDYIMRWLASRFCDADLQEELGILTPEVRAQKAAQEAAQSVAASEKAGPADEGDGGTAEASAGNRSTNGGTVAPTTALTDTPPVVPARLQGLDLGPACSQCGGIMQRTGSCYTCSSCGNNTGCG